MVMVFGITAAVMWTTSHRGLTVSVHLGLKWEKVIHPFDEEETLSEQKL
jgi:hypothetical protein